MNFITCLKKWAVFFVTIFLVGCAMDPAAQAALMNGLQALPTVIQTIHDIKHPSSAANYDSTYPMTSPNSVSPSYPTSTPNYAPTSPNYPTQYKYVDRRTYNLKNSGNVRQTQQLQQNRYNQYKQRNQYNSSCPYCPR